MVTIAGESYSEETTIKRLCDKSQEAFILAIELYNRPTIQYRVEGRAFFLCNAWELLLKAFLIQRNGERSIYCPEKRDRTLSLEDCAKRVFSQLFVALYGMKDDRRYSINTAMEGEQPWYAYPQQAVDDILSILRKDPEHVLDRVKTEATSKKEIGLSTADPRSMGILSLRLPPFGDPALFLPKSAVRNPTSLILSRQDSQSAIEGSMFSANCSTFLNEKLTLD